MQPGLKLQSFGQSLSPYMRSVYSTLLRKEVTDEMHKNTARLIDAALGTILQAGIGISSDALLGAMSLQMGSLATAVSDLCNAWDKDGNSEADKVSGVFNLRIAVCDRRYIKVFTDHRFYDSVEHKLVDRQVVPTEVISYSVTKIYVRLLQSDNPQKRKEAPAAPQASGPTEPPVQEAPAQ